MNNRILEEIQSGDFTNFNMLSENQQIEIMKKWDGQQWIRFRMQNTVSEKDVFDPILKLSDEEE